MSHKRSKLKTKKARRKQSSKPVVKTSANPQIHRLLQRAVTDHQNGQTAAAEKTYKKILTKDPKHLQALAYLGMLYQQTGDIEQAITALDKASRLKPDPSTLNNLGSLLLQKNRHQEAMDSFNKAVKLEPDYDPAHYNLGTLHSRLEQHKEAAFHYRRVIELKPQDEEAWNNLGLSLMSLGALDEASDCFKQAVALQAGYTDAHNNLGCVQMALGEMESARATFETAISIDFRFARAYENLARTKRFETTEDELIEKIHSTMKSPTPDDEALTCFHFALGKIYDDCASYDLAFQHYHHGNELIARKTRFNPQQLEADITKTIETFNSTLLKTYGTDGHPSSRPIFIVGMPRSGTTLVEQILSAHSDVASGGELNFVPTLAGSLNLTDSTNTSYNNAELFSGNSDNTEQHPLYLAGEKYLTDLASIDSSTQHVTDKLPWNFLHTGLLKLILPNARIIHCQRTALDTCVSIYFQRFSSHIDYAYSLKDLGLYYCQYHRLMEHWRSLDPAHYLELDYEELVRDPENQSRQLISFCGLDWENRCLNHHQNRQSVQTASNWQVRQPVYSRSVNRWKHYRDHLGELTRLISQCDEHA